MEQRLVFKPLRYGPSLSFYDYSYIEAPYTVAGCIEKVARVFVESRGVAPRYEFTRQIPSSH